MSVTGIEVSDGAENQPPAPAGHATSPVAASSDTVFSVLAAQARARTTSELRTTALGCAVSAGLLIWQHPSLSWLASAFLAASAYGAWGLVDRALLAESTRDIPDPGSLTFLRGWRATALAVGSSAALWTVFRFMAAALGGWQH